MLMILSGNPTITDPRLEAGPGNVATNSFANNIDLTCRWILFSYKCADDETRNDNLKIMTLIASYSADSEADGMSE